MPPRNPVIQPALPVFNPNDAVFVGKRAGLLKRAVTTDTNEVLIGEDAGVSLPDAGSQVGNLTYHTFIGKNAGGNCAAGAGGVLVGQKAGVTATTVQSSVAIGGKAASNYTLLDSDTMVGYAAGQFGASGATNLGRRTFIGYNAGQYDSGNYSIMIGYNAGTQNSGANANPTTGEDNVGVGRQIFNALKGGALNVGVGSRAMFQLTSGGGNFGLGYEALFNITTGGNNIAIGTQAGYSHTGSRCIFLGVSSGQNLPAASQNYFIAGADSSGGSDRIDHVYFGKGYATASPTNYTIWGTRSRAGTDSNTGGGDLTFCAGLGTGTGTLSSLVLQSPVAVASGSGVQTATTGLTIKGGCAVRPSYTVATLPAASTVGAGAMAWVTDANATTFLSTVAGGGSNKVPVSSDGTNWLIG